jgi:PAS domain S-box-containing protein
VCSLLIDHLTVEATIAAPRQAMRPNPGQSRRLPHPQDFARVETIKNALKARWIELEHYTPEQPKNHNATMRPGPHYEALYNRYANLFELSPNAYVVFDQTGSICEANLNAAIMFNLPKRELIGSSVTSFIHRDDLEIFYLLKQDCFQSSIPHAAELTMVQCGGRRFRAQIQLLMLPCSDKTGEEFRACILDLTENIRISSYLDFLQQCLEIAVKAPNTQAMLENYLQQIKHYTGCSAVGIRLLDDNGGIPYQVYDGFTRQFYEQENPLSLHTDQCLCIEVIKGRSDASKPFCTPFGSFYINGTSRFLATVPPEERGRTRNVCNAAGYESVALIPIFIDNDISGLIHVADRRENMFPLRVVQILEQCAMRLGLALQRFYLDKQLSNAVDDLRELSSHLLKAREEEQHRIAMELHDQTGQDLNVLKLRLKEIENELRQDQGTLKQVCAETRAYTDTIIESVRRLIHDLTPTTLETLGLIAGINQVIREFSERTPIHFETHLIALETITDHDTKVGLFRIIQEAVSNACKHSRTTHMCISAIETARNLHVTIEDNGTGFNPKRTSRSKGGRNGRGMQTMQLRARMLGGILNVQSWPGHGTRITVCLPLTNAQEVP